MVDYQVQSDVARIQTTGTALMLISTCNQTVQVILLPGTHVMQNRSSSFSPKVPANPTQSFDLVYKEPSSIHSKIDIKRMSLNQSCVGVFGDQDPYKLLSSSTTSIYSAVKSSSHFNLSLLASFLVDIKGWTPIYLSHHFCKK